MRRGRGVMLLGAAAVLAAIGLGAACRRSRPSAAAGEVIVLDACDDASAWRASGSDGVAAQIRGVPGARGGAVRLELDLGGTAGYAVARRELPLELPDDFELAFELRGEVPVNHLEVKLIDAS